MNILKEKIINSINTASGIIPKTWPLYSFVTANPLAGFEDMPFDEAIADAKNLFGASGYPPVTFFRQAWERKEINREILTDLLEQNSMYQTPEAYLEEMEACDKQESYKENPTNELDRLMVKWLSVFLDQGLTEWGMPEREKGFYQAWHSLACYDSEIPDFKKNSGHSADKFDALETLLADYPQESWKSMFQHHLAALPGWTGFIKFRLETNTEWQQLYPITLADYLAVRLTIAKHLSVAILPSYGAKYDESDYNLQKVWLKAWEHSYQKQLMHDIQSAMKKKQDTEPNDLMPDAQMVFCIDTRSELIRRHLEQAGNYETFGYAGFFGIPMDYQSYNSDVSRKSCPPILESAYRVTEKHKENEYHQAQKFNHFQDLLHAGRSFINNFKKNVPASFGFVEGAGPFYGFSLIARTISPKAVHYLRERFKSRVPGFEIFCTPDINPINKKSDTGQNLTVQMSLSEKVSIAKGAFDLMGWKDFAPLVAFIGHGSHTTNNPFGSSLDCGACAASPGRHNARILAMLCNQTEVRESLKAEHAIQIPSETIFLAGEHNTTTDEIILFEDFVPATHKKNLENLKKDLEKVKWRTTAERFGIPNPERNKSVMEAQKRATDWAETRPEWGLASNAAFIIGSRSVTRNINLQGRSFLHSYDWALDMEGSALESIMKGPLVVTQWINNHYYFSTVDNNTFGSGSKVTQNITGKFGVVQGNGGDLQAGLPLQSLQKDDDRMYHQPLRLTVLIHAPLGRVKRILINNKDSLMRLFENEWVYLSVMEPENENEIFYYRKGGKWEAESIGVNELEGISSSLENPVFEKQEVL